MLIRTLVNLTETISILRPVLKVSLFCIDHSMYWLNRIKLMMLHFDIHFNDKITQKKNELIGPTSLLRRALKPMFGHSVVKAIMSCVEGKSGQSRLVLLLCDFVIETDIKMKRY